MAIVVTLLHRAMLPPMSIPSTCWIDKKGVVISFKQEEQCNFRSCLGSSHKTCFFFLFIFYSNSFRCKCLSSLLSMENHFNFDKPLIFLVWGCKLIEAFFRGNIDGVAGWQRYEGNQPWNAYMLPNLIKQGVNTYRNKSIGDCKNRFCIIDFKLRIPSKSIYE